MRWLVPPVLFLFCLTGIGLTGAWLPGYRFLPPFNWPGIIIVAAGFAFGATGSGTFVRRHTNLHPFRDPGMLVTGGVFAISRNPMYLGLAVMLAGAAMMSGSVVPFALALVFPVVANLWYIPFEERRMDAKFGEQFQAYRQKTRRWL